MPGNKFPHGHGGQGRYYALAAYLRIRNTVEIPFHYRQNDEKFTTIRRSLPPRHHL